MSEPTTPPAPSGRAVRWTGDIGYDSTPGHRPAGRRAVPAVGDRITVAPTGFVGAPTWTGRITCHLYWRDGSYTGLSVAECLDARGFMNLVLGRGYQVEASRIRPVGDGDAA